MVLHGASAPIVSPVDPGDIAVKGNGIIDLDPGVRIPVASSSSREVERTVFARHAERLRFRYLMALIYREITLPF